MRTASTPSIAGVAVIQARSLSRRARNSDNGRKRSTSTVMKRWPMSTGRSQVKNIDPTSFPIADPVKTLLRISTIIPIIFSYK